MTASFDFEKLNNKAPKVRYGFTKELLKTGASSPEKLYGFLDEIGKMIVHDNSIIKWTAIDLVGYISAVDTANKTDKFILHLLRYLHCGELITVNHAIFALGQMAQNKLGHRSKILKQLISIRKDSFETEECRNIATGKVIDTLAMFTAEVKKMKSALDFIKAATTSTRSSTAKKAIKLLKLMQVEPATGKTKSVGYEIGAKRTLAVTPVTAWDFLLSDEGITVWLGALTDGGLSMNHNYKTADGIEGAVRILKPYSHIRLTWKKPNWQNHSTLQVRVVAVKKNTTIAIHQEKLSDSGQREEMKKYWEGILHKLDKAL